MFLQALMNLCINRMFCPVCVCVCVCFFSLLVTGLISALQSVSLINNGASASLFSFPLSYSHILFFISGLSVQDSMSHLFFCRFHCFAIELYVKMESSFIFQRLAVFGLNVANIVVPSNTNPVLLL